MANLIPLAGEGSRFNDAGYATPKPLIDVSGRPMIIQASHALPTSSDWVFLCRESQLTKYPLEKTLRKEYPNCKIISVSQLTEGQACTCLLAEPFLEPSAPLVIGACDNGMTWNHATFHKLMKDSQVDAIIWTFRNNITVQRNPHMYGWVQTDADLNATQISCKVPISDNPTQDHAIIGAFYFRQAAFFIEAAKKMITKNIRINNEFYVDTVLNELIKNGQKVKVFEVNKYVCWGTPNDLLTYNYWESYFKNKLGVIHE